MLCAGRHYQKIEIDRLIGKQNATMCRIDASNFTKPHGQISLPAQNRAYRPCHVRGREPCRCYLIKQRLKQVIVVPIDEDDRRICACQRPSREQTAEAGADDHDLTFGPPH